jgi:hypothetical protein
MIINVLPKRLVLPRSHNDPISKCFHWQTIVCMLGRCGLYSISICLPRGSNSVRVTLVLGIPCRGTEIIFMMGVREDASSKGAMHSHRLVPIN